MAVRKSKDAKINFMLAVNNMGQPLAVVAGFAVGKYALKKLSKSQTVSGLVGIEAKELFVPALVGIGGLVGMQFTDNQYIKIALVGAAGAGVDATITKLTGKNMLAGLEGLLGEDENEVEEIAALSIATQELPSADIDIEQEIQRSMQGASDFSMSDEPIGDASDFSMSDEPIEGNENKEEISDSQEDTDPFAGDMMDD